MGVTALYAVVLFFMGLCIAAAAPACNNPIFAEIVPPELRNMVSLRQCAAWAPLTWAILHMLLALGLV